MTYEELSRLKPGQMIEYCYLKMNIEGRVEEEIVGCSRIEAIVNQPPQIRTEAIWLYPSEVMRVYHD